MKRNIAIIGAGAAGLALTADLSRRGIDDVRLYDVDTDAIERVNDRGGVSYDGILGRGVARPTVTSTNPACVLDGVDLIIVSTTADEHASVARAIAPHVSDGQVILLHPGYVAGALHFRQVLDSERCEADVLITEAMNTVHLSAIASDGSVFVKGAKAWLEVAAYPNEALDRTLPLLQHVLPEVAPGREWFQTGLNNPNPMVHVPAYLGNLGLLGGKDRPPALGTLYFDELVNDAVRRVTLRLDDERRRVMETLGLAYLSLATFSQRSYPEGSRLTTGVPRIGPKLLPRFLSEDVPAGLVPIASLGRLTNTAVPVTEALINLANTVLQTDFWNTGRTVERLERLGASWSLDNFDASVVPDDDTRSLDEEGIPS